MQVVITGAAGGLGQSLVRSYLDQTDADIIGLCRRRPSGSEQDERITYTEVDLADPEAVSGLTIDGEIDVLVHCAAYGDNMAFADADAAQWSRYLTVNVTAAADLTRHLTPRFATRASVVFINSGLGLRASATSVPYSASKAALKSLADAIRPELNELGVSVTTVFPGQISTPMLERNVAAAGRAWRPDLYIRPDDLARLIMQAADPSTSIQLTDVVARPLREPW